MSFYIYKLLRRSLFKNRPQRNTKRKFMINLGAVYMMFTYVLLSTSLGGYISLLNVISFSLNISLRNLSAVKMFLLGF